MSENEYTISQVSKITGVSTSAINYYVRLNIIEPPKKTAKTRSSFSNLHIEKINEIKKLQNNGFPLKLIKKKLNSISTELKEFFSVEEIIEISEVSKLSHIHI